MKTDIVSYSNMDDIVFERRNKSYGAYILRKDFGKHVVFALLVCIAVGALAIGVPELIKLLSPKEEVILAPKPKVSIADLAPPPPIQETPPPPLVRLPPPPKDVIKFLPPKVTEKDVPEEEEMPTIDEVKKADVIGSETIEGPGDVVFDEPPVEVSTGEEEAAPTIFTVVEQMPEFPGGQEALLKFMSKNTRYPEDAQRREIQGVVYLSFVVDQEGKINDIVVQKGISKDCDEEAVRVVKKMPPWKPGKQSGRAVQVRFSLPFRFKLNQ